MIKHAGLRALAVAAVFTSAACGTTVQQLADSSTASGQPSGAGTGSDGLGAVSGSDGTGGPATGTDAGSPPGAASGTTGSRPSTGAAPRDQVPPPDAGANTPGVGRAGPGVTADKIYLGFYIPKNGDAAFGALGADVATGDGQAQTTAIINHLNATGGMGGRKIIPLFYAYDLANTDTSAQDQAACDHWTQDNKTFAVFSVNQESDLLLSCLAKRGTMYIADNKSIDNVLLNSVAPYFWAPGDFVADRFARDYVQSLAQQGFFPKGSKVGLLIRDTPRNARIAENVVRPALKAVGVELTKVGTVPYGASGANQQSNVLTFSGAGVNRVLALEVNPLFFMQQAESQLYRPLYGLHSGYSPGGLLQTGAPRAQLTGARAMGWIPISDVDAANDPGPVSKRQSLCFDLMRKAGQDTSVRVTALVMLWWCDTVFFVDDVLDGATVPSAAAFAATARRIGSSTVSAVTFSRNFAAGRVDGAAAYRAVAFLEACSCFRYVGPVRPLA